MVINYEHRIVGVGGVRGRVDGRVVRSQQGGPAMSCSHESCACQVVGCGLDHPADWKPAMTACINGRVVTGDDHADCVAHYLLSMGYPTDRPKHLRGIAERMAARQIERRSRS